MSAIDWELAAGTGRFSGMTATQAELATDLLAWSERLEETVITFEDFQREEGESKQEAA